MFSSVISEGETFDLRVNFNLKKISNVGGKRSQIWLSTTINGQRVRIFTKQLINPSHWVKSLRSDEGGGYAKEDMSLGRVAVKENKAINSALKRILGYCKEYCRLVSQNHLQVREDVVMSHSKDNFKGYIESKIKGDDFFANNRADVFIDNYIRQKANMTNRTTGRKISDGTLYNHKNAFNRLKSFVESEHSVLNWELFTADFETRFTSWMMSRNFTPNTIATQYSVMKVWLTKAEEKGLIEDKAFHHYSTKCYDVENIYLTEDEIKRLYDLDLSNAEVNSQSKVEETRDLFIVGCWTGLRYSDYSHLPQIDENTNTIKVHTQKTGQTVTIPLHPFVKAIYKKYGGVLPKPIDKGKAIKNIRMCARLAGISESVQLSKVKGGKDYKCTKEKYDFIVNHTARRSFATNMYLMGTVPIKSIMSITGHRTEDNFMKYIKLDADSHAKIVAKAFAERYT